MEVRNDGRVHRDDVDIGRAPDATGPAMAGATATRTTGHLLLPLRGSAQTTFGGAEVDLS